MFRINEKSDDGVYEDYFMIIMMMKFMKMIKLLWRQLPIQDSAMFRINEKSDDLSDYDNMTEHYDETMMTYCVESFLERAGVDPTSIYNNFKKNCKWIIF